MKLLSWLLILFGLFSILFSGLLYWERLNPQRLDFATPVVGENTASANFSQPKEIIIPNLAIDLPIFPSRIKNGVWETTTKGASFLETSPTPGQTGNSIIYAHNFTDLFGRLTKAKVGQEVEVVMSDGSVKKFHIKFLAQVSPGDVAILNPSTDSRITLYTCTGFLDSKRFVAVATLDS